MTASIYLPQHEQVQMSGLITSLQGRDVKNARILIEKGHSDSKNMLSCMRAHAHDSIFPACAHACEFVQAQRIPCMHEVISSCKAGLLHRLKKKVHGILNIQRFERK